MIRAALLYLSTPDDARGALREVAGRPVAFRALAAAVRAGCTRVGVPAIFRGTSLEAAVAMTPSARAAAVWLAPEGPLPDGAVVLLPAAAVTPPAALAALLDRADTAVLAESRESGAPVVAVTAGVARGLWRDVATGIPIGTALSRLLGGGGVTVTAADRWYARVVTDADARDAERRLYADLGSVIDTWLDRRLHRRLSRPISRRAMACGVTPNQISVASLVVGMAAAWCFLHATAWSGLAGIALYLVSVVLDHADGEVARLALAASRFGEWLDVVVDTIVHALIVLAMGVTTREVAGGGGWLGAVAAAGFIVSAWLAKTSPLPAADDRLGAFLSNLGGRDGFYAMLLAFVVVLGRWPEALPALMIVVALGAHAYWLGRAGHRLARRARKR